MYSVIITEKNGTQKTFGGDGYVYLNCGDVPWVIYMSKLTKLYTLIMCSFGMVIIP